MSFFGLSTLIRAAGAGAFVWAMAPHQPDLGLGRPQTIETLVADPASSCGAHAACGGEVLGKLVSPDTVEQSRDVVLATIDRVRADLAQSHRR